MKKCLVLSLGILFAVTLPLMAQAPYAPPGHAHTNVIVMDVNHQNNPSGVLPITFR